LKPKKLRVITTRDGLSQNFVMSLAQDADGVAWIGSNGAGLSARRNGIFAPADLGYVFDNECIPSLLAASDGTLWIGTWGSGLFHKSGAKVEQIMVAQPREAQPVLSLCEGRAGGVWVGTYQDGLKFFHDGQFTCYRTTNGLSANTITSLAWDAQGRLWIGTGGGGLNSFADGKFSGFTRRDGLASDFVRTLYVDVDGVLWVGASAGLTRLKDGRLATVTSQQGLWDDAISQILEDYNGNLWFGSDRGIFRVRKEELHAVCEGRIRAVSPIAFGEGEGMESTECSGGFCPAGLRTRDGQLWFSTVKGLVVIDPGTLKVNTQPPRVVVEEVWVDGIVKMREDALTNLEIGPGARRIEFRYTALSLTAPEKVRFRVRLDGLDPDWVEAGPSRVAEYSRLPPGHYYFRVSACNEDGVWNEVGAGLGLTILPALWQTLWFRLLLAAILLSSGVWVVKSWATRRLQRRLEILHRQHALEQERTRIARDIHDEMGALLTEISLLSDHGQKNGQRPDVVAADLRRISNTAREAVRTADGIVWAVNPSNDFLDHLGNYLMHYVEDFFRLTSIRCRLDLSEDLPRIPLSTQFRHHLLLVVKETCNNVVRHSDATEVIVRLSVADDTLTIVIEDNGKGICAEGSPGVSDGLLNMRQRMSDLGGTFDLSSTPGRGTRVELITHVSIKPI